ncbi:Glycosyltransferase involved in cell wall bisynthesis [Ruegeria halocynthiae]|uniref:Glycosyltransferase involved in cell wall bisynthesis n=1 Tax=Ruegeria halocynthiae TaxID=985054 RepID=A0A1H2Y651_9RHOB|nr:Glycosyltransferase involved in cell wall bisynthesis [Ruegeria halocynthiae]
MLKEARALHSAGHNVHIFCDWPGGLPQEDSIDGIRVTRFNWQSSEHISEDTLKHFFFVNLVSSEVERRVVPYVEAASQLNTLKSWFGAFLSDEEIQMLDPMYYKSYSKTHSGRERRARKFAHKRLLWKIAFRFGFGNASKKLSSLRSNTREVRERFRDLYQLDSFVFAENLRNLNFDETPDVIHAHDIYCLPAGVILAKQFDAKLVYDAHEYEPARAKKNPSNGSSFAEELEDDCLSFVDQMITVSPSIANLYSNRFKSKPALIFNAPEVASDFLVDYEEHSEGNLSVRTNAGLSADTPIVVFTGGVQTKHRGLDKVLEALVLLPDVYFVALGPRHKRDDKWLLETAGNLGVADRVKLLPPIAAADVPFAISSANVAVCPIQDASLSYRFAMPNKLFEAAFAGLPICISNLPDMRDFVEGLRLGRTMDQTDPQSIANALQEALDHPERFTPTAETYNRLWQDYSWEAQIKKLEILYDGL